MRRIFGAPKKKEPPPTLEQAGANLDARGNRIDEQIKKLDQQLMQFREQIRKTRPGPAQEALKRRALTVRGVGACIHAAHLLMRAPAVLGFAQCHWWQSDNSAGDELFRCRQGC